MYINFETEQYINLCKSKVSVSLLVFWPYIGQQVLTVLSPLVEKPCNILKMSQ